MNRTLIENALVVTMDTRRRVLHADILIEGSHIKKIGKGLADKDSSLRKLPRNKRIDGSRAIAMPGLVQAHVHLCQALFRGMADDLPLLEWLKQRIWPLEGAHSPRTIQTSARLGLGEMLLGGTTSILDMGTVHHQDAMFEVLRDSGIRAWAGKAMMDSGKGVPRSLRESTQASLRKSESLHARWNGSNEGLLHYAFSPRFILSCSERLLVETAERAHELGALVHSHASEHEGERKAVKAAYGSSDVRALAKCGIQGNRTVLAHGVQLTRSDMKFVAKAGTRFIHCPSANLKLASGVADVTAMREAGIVVGLGSDGAPCNNRMDAWTELRQAALLAKGKHLDATVMNAWQALELATIDGARVLGAEDQIGSLEVGKQADIALIDLDALHLPPLPKSGSALAGAAAALLVYSATAADVRDVFVAGRQLVKNRKLQTLDAEQIRADVVRDAKVVAKAIK